MWRQSTIKHLFAPCITLSTIELHPSRVPSQILSATAPPLLSFLSRSTASYRGTRSLSPIMKYTPITELGETTSRPNLTVCLTFLWATSIILTNIISLSLYRSHGKANFSSLYNQQTIQQTFMNDIEYQRPDHTGDLAWHQLTQPYDGYIYKYDKQYDRLRKHGISMFHAIHCLSGIRLAITSAALPNSTSKARRDAFPHVAHCLDYLRQVFLFLLSLPYTLCISFIVEGILLIVTIGDRVSFATLTTPSRSHRYRRMRMMIR